MLLRGFRTHARAFGRAERIPARSTFVAWVDDSVDGLNKIPAGLFLDREHQCAAKYEKRVDESHAGLRERMVYTERIRMRNAARQQKKILSS